KPGDTEFAVTDLDLGKAFGVEVELVGVLSDLCPGSGPLSPKGGTWIQLFFTIETHDGRK
ncbi:MAG: hypothetical protein B7Z54_05265, partial [Sphingobacteriales bacterium 12-47-4]